MQYECVQYKYKPDVQRVSESLTDLKKKKKIYLGMKQLAVFTNESLNQFCSNWCFCSNCFVLNWFVQNCDSFWNNTSDLIVFVMSHWIIPSVSLSEKCWLIQKQNTTAALLGTICFHVSPVISNSSRCHWLVASSNFDVSEVKA